MADTATATPTPADVADKAAQKDEQKGSQAQPQRLPDDHPLVTAFERQKQENDSLKEKARRLDEIEESQKTETEKVAERLAEAERKVSEIPSQVADALRTHLVSIHSISDEDRDLYLTSNDPDVLLRQAKGLADRGKARTGVVPTQGTADPAGSKVSPYDLGRERGKARYQKNS